MFQRPLSEKKVRVSLDHGTKYKPYWIRLSAGTNTWYKEHSLPATTSYVVNFFRFYQQLSPSIPKYCTFPFDERNQTYCQPCTTIVTTRTPKFRFFKFRTTIVSVQLLLANIDK